jgi:hypothetical protein
MTDRFTGVRVAFERDIGEDDAEGIIEDDQTSARRAGRETQSS